MTSRRPTASSFSFTRFAVAFVVVGGIASASAAGCGANDGVVGGECAGGYTQCVLSCVDLQTDRLNCGACGHECPVGVACVGGSCGGEHLDATLDGDGFGYDATDILVDGEICDFTDPQHPVCRPVPVPDANDGSQSSEDGGDGSTNVGEDGASDAGTDATLDSAGGDGNPNGGDGSTLDGTVNGDGSNDGSSNKDGTINEDGSSNEDGSMMSGDGSSEDGSMMGSDGAPIDAAPIDAAPVDACVPPFDTPAACGTCGNVCKAPNNLCELVDGGFQCEPMCAPPLVDCNGSCVNLARDPNNCGTCGTVCASQLCFLATCQGSVAGNIMVIGHDFLTASADQALLLTNSVFYNSGPVSLLSFEEYANGPAVANGLSIIKGYATAHSITLNVQSTSDPTAPANDKLLASENVVIVWDQPKAPSSKLGSLGTTWAPHLSKFVQGGGIVIVLDADQGVGEMPALLNNAALLVVTGHGVYPTGSTAQVPDFGLGIARGMMSVYAVGQNTAWFTTSEPETARTLYVVNVDLQPTQLIAVQKVVN